MELMRRTQPQHPTDFELMCTRIQEFFDERTLWHRQLWNIGTVLSLQEVLEYTEACLTGRHPNTKGLEFVIASTLAEVSRDPGVAHLAVELKKVLKRLKVKTSKDLQRDAYYQLEQLTHRAQAEYFKQWTTTTSEPVEFSSRAIASHLLDSGISNTQLYRWLQTKRSALGSLPELAEETHAMLTGMCPKQFNVFIPCSAPNIGELSSKSEGQVRWMDSHSASTWLKNNIPALKKKRQHGGFLVEVERRDPWAAVDAARSLISRADARRKIARLDGKRIVMGGWAHVAGNSYEFDLSHPSNKVEIGSLRRQKAIYDFDGGLPTSIDDALELASYMKSPSVGAAIIGGWSAIEALLLRPDTTAKKYLAADHCAALVTCSLPRAELTSLTYKHMDTANDRLADQIRLADTTYTKVWHAAEHLSLGKHLELTNLEDIAAQNRILAILENPADLLKRIRNHITVSLRRLYNQRNLIAHSGYLRSAVLPAAARTSFGLVGAGLDRVVHVQLRTEDKLSPSQLIARAETELNMVGKSGGRSPIFLLDQSLKHANQPLKHNKDIKHQYSAEHR